MISHTLAKELKEAGFPQIGVGKYFDPPGFLERKHDSKQESLENLILSFQSSGLLNAMTYKFVGRPEWTAWGNEFRGKNHTSTAETLLEALTGLREQQENEPLVMDEEYWAWWMERENKLGRSTQESRDNVLRYHRIEPSEAKIGYFIGGPFRIIDIRYLPTV